MGTCSQKSKARGGQREAFAIRGRHLQHQFCLQLPQRHSQLAQDGMRHSGHTAKHKSRRAALSLGPKQRNYKIVVLSAFKHASAKPCAELASASISSSNLFTCNGQVMSRDGKQCKPPQFLCSPWTVQTLTSLASMISLAQLDNTPNVQLSPESIIEHHACR